MHSAKVASPLPEHAPCATLEIPASLRALLKPHQVEALHFLWARLVEAHPKLRAAVAGASGVSGQGGSSSGSGIMGGSTLPFRGFGGVGGVTATQPAGGLYGAVLGHAMGLGKTLTSIAFCMLLDRALAPPPAAASGEGGTAKRHAGTSLPMLPAPPVSGGLADGFLQATAVQGAAVPRPPAAVATAAHLLPPVAPRVLVLAPKSVTLQWAQSCQEWITPLAFREADRFRPAAVPCAALSSGQPWRVEKASIEQFYTRGGLLIVGYEHYRGLVRDTLARKDSFVVRMPVKSVVEQALDARRIQWSRSGVAASDTGICAIKHADVLRGADAIYLDESHRLRVFESQSVQDLCDHMGLVGMRLAITGTPLQNHLQQYSTMVSVVNGRRMSAANIRIYEQQIAAGQSVDATPSEKTQMIFNVSQLRNHFHSIVHRRGPEILERSLSVRRQEFVIFIRLSARQEEQYTRLVDLYGQGSCRLLQARQIFTRVLTHPDVFAAMGMRPASGGKGLLSLQHGTDTVAAASRRQAAGKGLLSLQHGTDTVAAASRRQACATRRDSSAIDSEDGSEEDGSDASSGDDDGDGADARALLYVQRQQRAAAAAAAVGTVTVPSALLLANYLDSPKLAVCLQLVLAIVAKRERVVIYSGFVANTLVHLAKCLCQLGLRYAVVNGQLSQAERQEEIAAFADEVHGNVHVMLCSTLAGGVGLNLVCANHCILFDHSWNPTDDTQATFRVYRYGQKRNVCIYRLVAEGTIEHTVFHYALSKEWVHKKLADGKDPKRSVKANLRSSFTKYPCALPMADSRFTPYRTAAESIAACKLKLDVLRQDIPLPLPAAASAVPAARAGGLQPAPPALSSHAALPTTTSHGIVLDSVLATVSCIVPHSFLLRDDIFDRLEGEKVLREKRGRSPERLVSTEAFELAKRSLPPSLVASAATVTSIAAVFEMLLRGSIVHPSARGILSRDARIGDVLQRAALDLRQSLLLRAEEQLPSSAAAAAAVPSILVLTRDFCEAMAAAWPMWSLPPNTWSLEAIFYECYILGVTDFVDGLRRTQSEVYTLLVSRATRAWPAAISVKEMALLREAPFLGAQCNPSDCFSGHQVLLLLLARKGLLSVLTSDESVRVAVSCEHRHQFEVEMVVRGTRAVGRRMFNDDTPRLLKVLPLLMMGEGSSSGFGPPHRHPSSSSASSSRAAVSLPALFLRGMLSPVLLAGDWAPFATLPRLGGPVDMLARPGVLALLDPSRFAEATGYDGWLPMHVAAVECAASASAQRGGPVQRGQCPQCRKGALRPRAALPETSRDGQAVSASSPRCDNCSMLLDHALLALPHTRSHCTRYRLSVALARVLHFSPEGARVLPLPSAPALHAFGVANAPRLRRQVLDGCCVERSEAHAMRNGFAVFDGLLRLGIRLFTHPSVFGVRGVIRKLPSDRSKVMAGGGSGSGPPGLDSNEAEAEEEREAADGSGDALADGGDVGWLYATALPIDAAAQLFAAAYGASSVATLAEALRTNCSHVWLSVFAGKASHPLRHIVHRAVAAIVAPPPRRGGGSAASPTGGAASASALAWKADTAPELFLSLALQYTVKVVCAPAPPGKALWDIAHALLTCNAHTLPPWATGIPPSSSAASHVHPVPSQPLPLPSDTHECLRLLQLAADAVVVDLYLDLLLHSDPDEWGRLARADRRAAGGLLRCMQHSGNGNGRGMVGQQQRDEASVSPPWADSPPIHDAAHHRRRAMAALYKNHPAPSASSGSGTDSSGSRWSQPASADDDEGRAAHAVTAEGAARDASPGASVSSDWAPLPHSRLGSDADATSGWDDDVDEDDDGPPPLHHRPFPTPQEVHARAAAAAAAARLAIPHVGLDEPFPIAALLDVKEEGQNGPARCSAADTRARELMFAAAYRRVYGSHATFHSAHDVLNFMLAGVAEIGPGLLRSFSAVGEAAWVREQLTLGAIRRCDVPSSEPFYTLEQVVVHFGRMLGDGGKYVPLCKQGPGPL